MSRYKLQAISSSPLFAEFAMEITTSSLSPTDEATNIVLSELSLGSAIEIERLQKGEIVSFVQLRELGQLLGKYDLSDLALVPVYDRAIASTTQTRTSSTSELKSKLQEISKKMESISRSDQTSAEMLKEFCLSLHEVLLNYRVENFRRSAPNQMAKW